MLTKLKSGINPATLKPMSSKFNCLGSLLVRQSGPSSAFCGVKPQNKSNGNTELKSLKTPLNFDLVHFVSVRQHKSVISSVSQRNPASIRHQDQFDIKSINYQLENSIAQNFEIQHQWGRYLEMVQTFWKRS